jgi:hypothetical protein
LEKEHTEFQEASLEPHSHVDAFLAERQDSSVAHVVDDHFVVSFTHNGYKVQMQVNTSDIDDDDDEDYDEEEDEEAEEESVATDDEGEGGGDDEDDVDFITFTAQVAPIEDGAGNELTFYCQATPEAELEIVSVAGEANEAFNNKDADDADAVFEPSDADVETQFLGDSTVEALYTFADSVGLDDDASSFMVNFVKSQQADQYMRSLARVSDRLKAAKK